MPPQAILFDLDDTLLDHSGIQRRLAVRLQQVHAAFAAADAETLALRSMQHLEDLHPRVVAGELTLHEARVERYRRLLREVDAAEHDAVGLAHWHAAAYAESETTVPGAPALVAAARALGMRLAIVSNNTRAEQQRKLDRHGLAPHFDALVVAADHGFAKPDPRLFRLALDALRVEAPEAVMVGDSWAADVVGARAAGIRAVWFNRFGARPGDDAPIAQVTSFDDVEAALAAIVGR